MLVEVKNNIGSRQVFLWIRLSKYVSSSSHFQHANTLEPDSLLVTFDPESYEPYRTPLLDEPNERGGSRSATDPSSPCCSSPTVSLQQLQPPGRYLQDPQGLRPAQDCASDGVQFEFYLCGASFVCCAGHLLEHGDC